VGIEKDSNRAMGREKGNGGRSGKRQSLSERNNAGYLVLPGFNSKIPLQL